MYERNTRRIEADDGETLGVIVTPRALVPFIGASALAVMLAGVATAATGAAESGGHARLNVGALPPGSMFVLPSMLATVSPPAVPSMAATVPTAAAPAPTQAAVAPAPVPAPAGKGVCATGAIARELRAPAGYTTSTDPDAQSTIDELDKDYTPEQSDGAYDCGGTIAEQSASGSAFVASAAHFSQHISAAVFPQAISGFEKGIDLENPMQVNNHEVTGTVAGATIALYVRTDLIIIVFEQDRTQAQARADVEMESTALPAS